MAVIDIDRDVVVIRIVYVGLESAGKSASVESLAEILTRKKPQIFSVEKGFRDTLDFDWLEHTGGFFHGRPITSQIIGIPSKLTTSRRNPLLLESDVVIFVLDVNREKKNENLKYFNQLRKILARKEDEPIGIVIQANKQDQENILSSDEIAALFKKYPNVKITESTATEKRGVREAFVLAVHSAIKQTEQLKITNKLKIGHLDIKTGEELLNFLAQFPDIDEEIPDVEDEENESIEDFSEEFSEESLESPEEFEDIQKVIEESVDLPEEVVIFEDSTEKSFEESLESADKFEDIQEITKESADLPEEVVVFEDSVEKSIEESLELSDKIEDIQEFTKESVDLPEESIIFEDSVEKSIEESLESSDKFEDIQGITEESVDLPSADLPQEVAVFEDSVEKPLETANEFQDIQEVIEESSQLSRIPDKNANSQWVWPPMAGRRLLKEFLSQTLTHSVDFNGTQILQTAEWLAFSKSEWTYTTVFEVREALKKYTRLHLHCSSVLSEQRCIAILPETEGEQRWRLWQILRTRPTLSDQLRMALQAREMNVILLETFRCASRYIEVYQRCSRLTPSLSLNLSNIGIDEDNRLIYLGNIDEPTDSHTQSNADILIETLKHLFVTPIVNALQHTDINVEVLFKSTLSVLTAPFKRKKMGKKKKN